MYRRLRTGRRLATVVLLTALASGLLGGCSTRALVSRALADQLAGQGMDSEEDLGLARDASAFYLKLSESVLAQDPGHVPLAEAVAAGYTQYAYAFVAFEAERLESAQPQAAAGLRQRAARLYLRAQRHALAALAARQPGLMQALSGKAQTLQLNNDEVGLAYWAAASWAAGIALSKDQPERVADLPRAIQLARLAYQRQPEQGQGALASLMGSLEAARPGGSMAQATAWFDQAITLSAGQSAAPLLAKAEAVALSAGDRVAFEQLLRQALGVAQAHPGLANEVMKQRAQWLLDTADDRF